MKIRAGIMTWLLLLVLLPSLPLLLFASYSAYRYADERRSTIETDLTTRANTLAANVRQVLARNFGYIASLAASDAAARGDIEGLYNIARRIRDSNPEIIAVTLIDKDGKMLFLSSLPFGQATPTAQIAAAQEVFRTGKPVASSVFRSPINDRFLVALAVPVMQDGKVAYCLRAILNVDTINAVISPDKLPPGWVAAVTDANGRFIARSLSPGQFVGQQGSPQLVAAIQNRTEPLWEGVTREGVVTQTALRPIGTWGWYLAIGVPKASLAAPWKQDVQILVGLGGAMLALGLGLAIWLSRRITLSIRDTVQATKAVLRGEVAAGQSAGITELDQMHRALTEVEEYGRLLEQRVDARTAELQSAKERISRFADQQERTVEAERQRISREVHDQIGAVLTGIKMIFRGLPTGVLPQGQERELITALDLGVATARRIASELRPPLIDDLGLQAAVEQLLETSFRGNGIIHAVRLDDADILNERQALAAYRIIQEASTNVLRHARASHFAVTGRVEDNSCYGITIMDDGIGMSTTAGRPGALGVAGMQERAELLGGSLTIGNTPHGSGVVVSLQIPLSRPDGDPPDEDPAP